MKIIDDIANIFFVSDLMNIEDDFYRCEATYSSKVREVVFDHSQLENINSIMRSEYLTYNVSIKYNNDVIIAWAQESKTGDVLHNIREELNFLEDNPSLEFCIKIHKTSAIEQNNNSHIFVFKNFVEGPLSQPDLDFIEFLKEFDLSKIITFKVWDEHIDFGTEYIRFEHITSKPNHIIDSSLRESTITKRNKSCHFTNDAHYKFMPDDFKLLTLCPDPVVSEKFYRLMLVFVLIYLCDYSEIIVNDESYLDYKMKGYRLISNRIKLDSISSLGADELYGIYDWVYNQGNFIDKIGLAKNIISIHMTGDDFTTLSKGALRSIESGYDIYLKENVKQYIEIKNKISEMLISQADKASEITKNMFATLKTSFWSLVSFFVTIVLVKILSAKNEDTVIISGEIVILMVVFTVFSFIYLLLSEHEVREEKTRLFDRYTTIKDRYKDLLNENDLNKIIDTDNLISKDEVYIQRRRKAYRWIWISFNFIMLLAVAGIYLWQVS
ncbi:hypothetical protein [Pantoea agglomerans]|uniref:hypothetical protein n=1 Tax=Enterobacter agglomerans TaxID=549 RepID=UPI00320A0771